MTAGYRDALHHLLDITYFPDEPGYLPMDLILQQLNIHDLCDFIHCPSSNFFTLQYEVVDHSGNIVKTPIKLGKKSSIRWLQWFCIQTIADNDNAFLSPLEWKAFEHHHQFDFKVRNFCHHDYKNLTNHFDNLWQLVQSQVPVYVQDSCDTDNTNPASTVGEPETINNKLKLVLPSDMSNSTVESMIPVTVPHSIDSEDVSNDFQVKHEVPTVNIVTPDDKINSEKENDKEEHSNQIRFDTTQISIVTPCYSPQEIYENDWEEETNFTDTWECIYMDWLEEEFYNPNINSDEVEIIFETYQDSPPPQTKPPELGNNKIPLFPSNVITPQSLKSNIKMVDLTTEEMITFITTPRSYSKSSNVSQ